MDMYSIFNEFSKYLGYGTLTAIFAYILFKALIYPEKAQEINRRVKRALAWLGTSQQRKYIAYDISIAVNKSASNLNSISKDVCPYDLELEWLDLGELTPESFLKDGKIVLRMNYYKDQIKNLSNVMYAYVNDATMPIAKEYLDSKITKAMKY